MWFELQSGLGTLDLGYAAGFDIVVAAQTEPVTLTFTLPKDDPLAHLRQAMCTARLQRQPPPDVLADFQLIAEGTLPPGSSKSARAWLDEQREARLRWNEGDTDARLVPIDLLPDPVRSFVDPVWDHLREVTQRAVRVMRWRNAMRGPPHAASERQFRWSLDEQQWLSLSRHGMLSGSVRVIKPIEQSRRDELAHLIDEGADEPLAHALLREAEINRNRDALRSALILAVAAIEIGVKRFIATAIPGTAWLLEQIQSPPTHKLLSDYLPTLPAKQTIDGKLVFTKAMRKTVHRAVELRNKIVHRGDPGPDYKELSEILKTSWEVLRLLDHYSGTSWALEHILAETRSALDSEASSQ